MRFLIVLSLFSISSALAAPFQPARVSKIFVPQVTATVEYDDNIYTEETDTVSSFIYYLSPAIAFTIEKADDRYGGEYILTSSFYTSTNGKMDEGDDDRVDHRLSLFAHNELASRHRTDLNFDYDNLHDRRGSELTDGNPYLFLTPIDYNERTARFHYQFGGRNAKMRIGGGLRYYDKTYASYTDYTKYSDLDEVTLSADADYQIGNVTFLTFDVLTTQVSYKHRFANNLLRDNQDSRALVGLTWRGVSKINGRARVGYQYKTFDELEGSDFNGNTVDLRVNFRPKQRATYFINLSRVAEDDTSSERADYINNVTGSLGWGHNWTDKIDSNIQFEYSREDYIGAVRDREDRTTTLNAYLLYGFSRWLNLSAGFEHSSSSSNVSNFDYDRNIFTLSLKVGL